MFRSAGENRASPGTALLAAAALFGLMLSANVNDATAASKYRSVTSGPSKVVIGTGKWSFGFRDKRSKPVLREQPGTGKGPIGRLGFEAAGGRCVFTSEWDRFAQKTYKANFADHELHGDIRRVERLLAGRIRDDSFLELALGAGSAL